MTTAETVELEYDPRPAPDQKSSLNDEIIRYRRPLNTKPKDEKLYTGSLVAFRHVFSAGPGVVFISFSGSGGDADTDAGGSRGSSGSRASPATRGSEEAET